MGLSGTGGLAKQRMDEVRRSSAGFVQGEILSCQFVVFKLDFISALINF